ncbi:6,7-dimethyl-8-ribityllumazine synthase [Rubellicoccus peritrichatus]|uniref:6,7-dimethyl-8-ribityllumazine synthase n=1 Tax=Rubellicoccus peritrichatus TaxID=3080537 RepID=A0AAQ3LDP2_9BACT|nr:6,7-dimethyl-8-ribityllumazine synthase [Puniceicoccus sp. CR14]WOO42652.1 6,7-dimethyl-8-ribityllumazine synthase [Puniceicoccus sp. CR14]
MSLDRPNAPEIDGSDLFFCIVAARYNPELVDALIQRTTATLQESGVREANIKVMRVPGSNELPYGVYMHALSRQYDCVIALGIVIAGETDHHSVIADSTADAFHKIGMETEVPVINGVVTVGNMEQAVARTTGDVDRGAEFARAALEMAWHKLRLVEMIDEIEEDLLTDDDDDDDLETLFRKN